MTPSSCRSAHGFLWGLPQLKDKKPLLIGPAESVRLPWFNRLHAWNYTCPMMDSRVSVCFRPPRLVWLKMWGWQTVGKLRWRPHEVMMAFCKRPRLLDLAKTPTHLQFNKYVLTGYRPVSTAQECLGSLFYMHNELGNIYTHGKSRGHSMISNSWFRTATEMMIVETWGPSEVLNRRFSLLVVPH